MGEFTSLPDLAVRTYGGSVLAASDESFAERENLINPWRPRFQPETFGPKGQVYDGWETARRRAPVPWEPGDLGHDWALVRLGIPGVVRGVVIDTAWFKGNYPPEAAVEGCDLHGNPSVAELAAADWFELVPRGALTGDAVREFPVRTGRRVTHVRLAMYPDGGIARLRVHGEPLPDPGLLDGLTVDLAALENGAGVTECSDMFYSRPDNILAPGRARHQAEGWETARRRDGGNDWVVVRLALPGVIRLAEIDTSNLKFNAPGGAELRGRTEDGTWVPLLGPVPLQPDQPHRFRVHGAPPVTAVRLDIHPDGGLARLRLLGDPTAAGLRALSDRFAAARTP